MAINIAKSNFALTVTDLREQPLRELEQYGARAMGSAREVAAASDLVLASLPSNEASEKVALDSDGVLAGAKSGDIYIDLSTISPDVVRGIARKAAEQGVDVLDAPVSGGLRQRREGRLAIMIGGDAGTVARARPVLETFADKIFHVGATGTGATMKLVNNLLNGINMVATMEALVLGVKAGLSVEKMKEVISVSSGGSRAFDSMIDLIMTRSPEPPAGETANMGPPDHRQGRPLGCRSCRRTRCATADRLVCATAFYCRLWPWMGGQGELGDHGVLRADERSQGPAAGSLAGSSSQPALAAGPLNRTHYAARARRMTTACKPASPAAWSRSCRRYCS